MLFVALYTLSVPYSYLLTITSGRKWFDCAECHAELEDHPLLQQFEMVSNCGAKQRKAGWRANCWHARRSPARSAGSASAETPRNSRTGGEHYVGSNFYITNKEVLVTSIVRIAIITSSWMQSHRRQHLKWRARTLASMLEC